MSNLSNRMKKKIRKCKWAKAGREKYKQDKLIGEQRVHEERTDEIIEPLLKRYVSSITLIYAYRY